MSKNNLWTLDKMLGLWPPLRWILHLSPWDRASGNVFVAGRYFIFSTSSQVIFSFEVLSSSRPSCLISCCLRFQYCCSGQQRCVTQDVSGLRGTGLRASIICPADIKADTSQNPVELSGLSVSVMVLVHFLLLSHMFFVCTEELWFLWKRCVFNLRFV